VLSLSHPLQSLDLSLRRSDASLSAAWGLTPDPSSDAPLSSRAGTAARSSPLRHSLDSARALPVAVAPGPNGHVAPTPAAAFADAAAAAETLEAGIVAAERAVARPPRPPRGQSRGAARSEVPPPQTAPPRSHRATGAAAALLQAPGAGPATASPAPASTKAASTKAAASPAAPVAAAVTARRAALAALGAARVLTLGEAMADSPTPTLTASGSRLSVVSRYVTSLSGVPPPLAALVTTLLLGNNSLKSLETAPHEATPRTNARGRARGGGGGGGSGNPRRSQSLTSTAAAASAAAACDYHHHHQQQQQQQHMRPPPLSAGSGGGGAHVHQAEAARAAWGLIVNGPIEAKPKRRGRSASPFLPASGSASSSSASSASCAAWRSSRPGAAPLSGHRPPHPAGRLHGLSCDGHLGLATLFPRLAHVSLANSQLAWLEDLCPLAALRGNQHLTAA